MSFAKQQKEEILLSPQKNLCCRRSFLSGILAAKAKLRGNAVDININDEKTAEHLGSLLFEIYGRDIDLTFSRLGGKCKTISFKSKSASKYLRNFSISNTVPSKCSMCRSSFYRGIFVASGRISDPSKLRFLELCVNEERLDTLLDIFSEEGIPFSTVTRNGERSIYSKRSEVVEDFFAMAGMNNTVFALMNAKINSEFRNNANRVSNCETNNISRAVEASLKQINLISKLQELGLLSSLPEELIETAKLRMKYKDMSLSQLALVSLPPISKSGLSHRLKKITQIAKQLLEKNNTE